MDSNELIQQWLKDVRTEPPANGADGEANRCPFFPPDSPFARMKSAPERQEPQPFRKRQLTPDLLDRKQAKTNELEFTLKKERHGYERRPRHRTKEDRYEYKPPEHCAKREKQSKKKKASKRNRRHTINENFHASNVAQDRLTLNSRMNMGLFGKGRTSSPVKSRELPDLVFSEMNFLSKRSRQNPEELPEDRYGNIKAAPTDDFQIPQYFSNDYPEESPVMDGSPLFVRQDTQSRTDPLAISFSPDNGQFAVDSTTYEDLIPARVQRDSKHQKDKRSFSSATPYTWSESEYGVQKPQVTPEDCKKGLLCVDTNHQHISDTEKATKRYWGLDELKLILSIRQRRRSEDEQRKASMNPLKRKRPSFEADEVLIRHSKRTEKNANENAFIRGNIPSSPSSRTERCPEPNSPPHGQPGPEDSPKAVRYSECSQESQDCDPPSGLDITEEIPIHELNLETEWADMLVGTYSREITCDGDNDVIMNDFDAAYDAIVHSADGDPAYELFHGISSNEGSSLMTEDYQSHPLLSGISINTRQAQNPIPSFGTSHQAQGVYPFTSSHHRLSREPSPGGVIDEPGLWQGHSRSITPAFGMASVSLGTGFSWRQNKLY